jgi:hypothetical protein
MLNHSSIALEHLSTVATLIGEGRMDRIAIACISHGNAVVIANLAACLVEQHTNELVGHIRFCAPRRFRKAVLNSKTHRADFARVVAGSPTDVASKIAGSISSASAMDFNSKSKTQRLPVSIFAIATRSN